MSVSTKGEDIPERHPYGNPSLSKLQFSFKQSGGNRVMAHHPDRAARGGPDAHKPVGFIEWHKTTGEIMGVGTHPEFARQGLATHLMSYARQISADSQPGPKGVKGQRSLFKMPVEKPHKTIVAPQHSTTRTEAGEKWARSVGGHLPPRASRGRRAAR